MKRLIVTLLLITGTLLVSGLAAQPQRFRAPTPDTIDLPGGARFSVAGREYEHVPRAAAIQTAALGGRLQPGVGGPANTAAALRAFGLQAVRVKQDHGTLIVYERNAAGTLALVETSGVTNYPVVRNVQTGQTGYLSGQIRLRLHTGASPYALAAAADLTVYANFPDINIAFLRVPPGRDLAQAASFLAGLSGVAAADIEVIEQLNRSL